ncbi:cytochrome c oxidase assembly factor Coa1 family protein [Archangium sp.]|jgi:hypothetical protein|uniref:cytochrome c oxidase assembly factor Coa1 family protein n=1 Tax=Archangium sp. TaxID=1872627 RepID=UPI002ED84A86
MNTVPEGELAAQRGWWSRNWTWVVPTGCLGLLLSCGCLGAVFFGVITQSLRGSGAVVEAVALARQSPEVRQALGEPIEQGLWVQGRIHSGGDQESADVTLPLKGPKAEGTLRMEAYKNGDAWTFTTLQVEVPGQPPIHLLGDAPAPPPHTLPFPKDIER